MIALLPADPAMQGHITYRSHPQQAIRRKRRMVMVRYRTSLLWSLLRVHTCWASFAGTQQPNTLLWIRHQKEDWKLLVDIEQPPAVLIAHVQPRSISAWGHDHGSQVRHADRQASVDSLESRRDMALTRLRDQVPLGHLHRDQENEFPIQWIFFRNEKHSRRPHRNC